MKYLFISLSGEKQVKDKRNSTWQIRQNIKDGDRDEEKEKKEKKKKRKRHILHSFHL